MSHSPESATRPCGGGSLSPAQCLLAAAMESSCGQGTVPIMSAHIRDCFIELYDHPVLEDLRDSLQMRYPDIEFPPVPERGQLNLDLVRSSKYFFH